MLGSWARALHEGRAGDGFPGTEHRVEATWAQWNLSAQLGVVERFGLDFMLPLRLTSLRASAFGPQGRPLSVTDTIHRDQRLFSPGDLLVATRWGLVRNEQVRGWTLDLRLGATLPTGVVRRDPFSRPGEGPARRPDPGSSIGLLGMTACGAEGRFEPEDWSGRDRLACPDAARPP